MSNSLKYSDSSTIIYNGLDHCVVCHYSEMYQIDTEGYGLYCLIEEKKVKKMKVCPMKGDTEIHKWV